MSGESGQDQCDVPWFQGLGRVPNEQATGLSGDFSETRLYDHVFYGGLGGTAAEVFLEKQPVSPYRGQTARGGRATIVGGSDHVWLDVLFSPALRPSAR